jgi:hypothetical protein
LVPIKDFAVIRIRESKDGLEERGLSGTVGTENSITQPGLELRRKSIQDGFVIVGYAKLADHQTRARIGVRGMNRPSQ